MNEPASLRAERKPLAQSLPFYYGWVNVVIAAVAMTATLPGRTHGLGLITEPLLADLEIDRVLFARINLVGSLAGAAFCIPIGWLIDRFGVRSMLLTVTAGLGISVIAMSKVEGAASLLITLILVRGFGQSALSVVSIAAVGKWFQRSLGIAMGVFAVLLTFGFIVSVLAMGSAIAYWEWRDAWHHLGIVVVGLAPLFWLIARSDPQSCGVLSDGVPERDQPFSTSDDFTFRRAIATPAFWVLMLGSSAFNLVWSGVTLFNESILAESGMSQAFAVQIMAILTGVGLVANLVGGKFATRNHVMTLMAVGLMLLSLGLVALPLVSGPIGARIYAVAIGLSGGIVTVVFFASWRHLYGQSHLGRIQGAAQLATVLASAVGPILMAESAKQFGSYTPTLVVVALFVAILAVVALRTHPPTT